MSKRRQTKKHDWDRAIIVAKLHMKGWSIRKLSKHHEYADPTTLSQALNKPWPKGEKLIAEAIGVTPADIWPSRYPMGNSTATGENSPLETRHTNEEAA